MVRAQDPCLNPVLLHARFAMGDRLEIEKHVCASLGPGNNPDRERFVLIGTQILEAPLDYDVDAMVTDIAPIDLIIQRAGRLWRHADRESRPAPHPELLVLSAEPTMDADANWYDAASQRAKWVYQHHGIVWRSAAKLFADATIDTPGGVRGLVEAVYGPDRSEVDDVPEALRRASLAAFGESLAAQTFAHANLLQLSQGYAGQHNAWTPDTITPTRLGDEVTVFRLGKRDAGRIVPYYGGVQSSKNWALSEVSVSRRKATGVPSLDKETERSITAAKQIWPNWEEAMPLLVLKPEAASWSGSVTNAAATTLAFRYDKTTGFRLSA